MNPIENLQNQLLEDMERFGDLMNRQAGGDDVAVQTERDQLEGAVEIKLAILEGLKKLAEEQPEELLFDTEQEFIDVKDDEEW